MSITITLGGVTMTGAGVTLSAAPPPTATDGWWAGGSPSNCAVSRITFATDTASATTRGPLAFSQFDGPGSTGNGNYGWFGGGKTGAGSVTRNVNLITYANDTATAVSTGQLYWSSFFLAAAGTSSSGWFAGGLTPASGQIASISKIDYAVTTATATSRGNLSNDRGRISSTSDNTTYGWFGGGLRFPGPSSTLKFSTVDRITYANDTATASVRGPLSATKYSTGSAGTDIYGWFTGGTIDSTLGPSVYTTVDRITYATDTATASVRGPLVTRRMAHAGLGNAYYGWFGGGYTPGLGTLSSVDRVDYSNDTITASTRGNTARFVQGLGATANTP
jgi:hypothetical protein